MTDKTTTGSDAVDLDPCPFCGSTNISAGEVSTTDAAGETVVQSVCMDCGACGPGAALDEGEIDYGDVKSSAAWNRRALIAQARAAAPTVAAEKVETEMAERLRRIVVNIGEGPIAVTSKLLTQAADECDRFYNGMMAWKRTAEAKDREFAEARAAAPAAQAAQTQAERIRAEVDWENGLTQLLEGYKHATDHGITSREAVQQNIIDYVLSRAAAPAATAQAPHKALQKIREKILHDQGVSLDDVDAVEAVVSQQPVQAAGLTAENLWEIHGALRTMGKVALSHKVADAAKAAAPVIAAPTATAEPVATVEPGKFANRLQWVSDEAMASVPVGAKLYAAPLTDAPEGFALVPLRMTMEMQQVVTDEEWQWEDLLAAAEAITEDQYNSIASGAASAVTATTEKLAHGHRDDYFLMANARRLALEPIHKVVRMRNWEVAMELFATGSNSAHQICHDAGIDPDGYKIDRAAMAATKEKKQ